MSLPPLVEPAAELTIDEVRRYSRHLIIPDVGMTGQKRLKNAKVLVIGAGGLGSPGAALPGRRRRRHARHRRLRRWSTSPTCSARSSTASPTSASPRPSRPRSRSREINPYVEVILHEERLDSDNALEIFERVRPDPGRHRQLRHPLPGQRRRVLLGKPYVWGSIYRFEGQVVGVLGRRPTAGLNYRDLYPEPPPPGHGAVLRRGRRARRAVRVDRRRSWSTEAIKLITGIGEPLLGRLMVYDALEMTYRTIKIRKDPTAEPITELIDYDAFCGVVSDAAADAAADATISVKTLKGMLAARDRGERLPAGRRPRAERVRDRRHPRLGADPQGRDHPGEAPRPGCRRTSRWSSTARPGERSAEALALREGAGFADAVHVGGGVVAWVSQIEPERPSYPPDPPGPGSERADLLQPVEAEVAREGGQVERQGAGTGTFADNATAGSTPAAVRPAM